jgi:hypothetical protein
MQKKMNRGALLVDKFKKKEGGESGRLGHKVQYLVLIYFVY